MLPLLGGALVDSVKTAFGRVLRRARLKAKMTQEQLGLSAGVARNFVSLIELGQNQPSLETLFRLAYTLGQSPAQLLTDVEKELTASKWRRSAAPRK